MLTKIALGLILIGARRRGLGSEASPLCMCLCIHNQNVKFMNHLYLSFTCAFPWTCVLLVLFNEVFYFLQNSVTDKFIPCQAHFARLWVLNSTVIRPKYSYIPRNIRLKNNFPIFGQKLLKIIPLRSKFRKCTLYALCSTLYAHALATPM